MKNLSTLFLAMAALITLLGSTGCQQDSENTGAKSDDATAQSPYPVRVASLPGRNSNEKYLYISTDNRSAVSAVYCRVERKGECQVNSTYRKKMTLFTAATRNHFVSNDQLYYTDGRYHEVILMASDGTEIGRRAFKVDRKANNIPLMVKSPTENFFQQRVIPAGSSTTVANDQILQVTLANNKSNSVQSLTYRYRMEGKPGTTNNWIDGGLVPVVSAEEAKAKITIASPGVFSLEITAYNISKAVIGKSTINRVIIGDIFVVSSLPPQLEGTQAHTNKQVFYWGDKSFVDETVAGNTIDEAWLRFAEKRYETTNYPVGLLHAGLAEGSINTLAKAIDASNTVTGANAVNRGILTAGSPSNFSLYAVLYQPSVADVNAKTAANTEYETSLKTIITALTTKLGNKPNVYVGKFSKCPSSDASGLAALQQRVQESLGAKVGYSMDALTDAKNWRSGSCSLTTAGLNAFVDGWVDAVN